MASSNLFIPTKFVWRFGGSQVRVGLRPQTIALLVARRPYSRMQAATFAQRSSGAAAQQA